MVTAHFALGQDAVNLYNEELANQTIPQQLQFIPNPQPSISSDELPQSSPVEAPNHQHQPEPHPENVPQLTATPLSPAQPPQYAQPIIQFSAIADGIQSHYQDQNVLQAVDVPLLPQQVIPSHISPLTTYMYPVNIEQQPYSHQENHLPDIQPPVDEQIPQNINEPQSTPTFTELVAKTQNLVTSKDVLDINQSVDEQNKNSLFKPNLGRNDNHKVATNGQVQNYLETENHFDSPIVVSEDNPANLTNELGLLQPRHGPKSSSKQINLQIIDTNNKNCLEETSIDAKMINPYAPLSPANVETPKSIALPPSETSQLIYSTTSSTAETSSTERYTEELTISSTPLSNNFLAPIHAAVRLSYDGKHLENCLDLVQRPVGDSVRPEKHHEVVKLPKDDQIAFLPTVQSNEHIQLEFGERFVPKHSKQPILAQFIQHAQQQVVAIENQVHEGEADKSADHTEKPVALKLVDSSLTLENHVGAVVESTAELPVEVQQQVLLQYPTEKYVPSTHSLDYLVANSVQPNVNEQPSTVGQAIHSPTAEYNIPNSKVLTSFVYEHIPAEGLGGQISHAPYQVQENVIEKIAFYQQPISDGRNSNIPFAAVEQTNKPVDAQPTHEQPKQLPQIVQKYLYQPVEHIEHKQYQTTKPIERAPVSNNAPASRPIQVQYNTVKDLKNPYLVYYTLPYQLTHQHHIDQNAHYQHDLHRSQPDKQIFAYIQPTYAKQSYQPKSTHPIYLSGNSLQASDHKLAHHHSKDHHQVLPAPQTGGYHYDRPKPVYGVPLPDIKSQKLSGNEHLFPNRQYPQQNYAGTYDYQSNIYRDDYFGPPPLVQQQYQHQPHSQHPNCPPSGVDSAISGSERTESTQRIWKRLNSGKNMQWEYGFKPPMVPSIEIDEFGNPISRSETR